MNNRGIYRNHEIPDEKWFEKHSYKIPGHEHDFNDKVEITHTSTDTENRNRLGSPKESPKKQKRENEEEKRNYALDLPGVIEVLDVGDKLVYFTENHEIVESLTVQDKTYFPPPKELCPYLFADTRKVEEYLQLHTSSSCREDIKLYEELLQYHKDISDLPDENLYDLLTLWDFHTYFIEKIHFSPIIYLYAVKERGKSRTGKGCIYVSRRGIWTEAVREADIIRWGNNHRAALGFDVKDAPKKFERANCDDLILARFEKGSTSSRTLWPEKGPFRDTKTFNLFGPTIIATNRPVDDILESRSISVDMKPTSRVFDKPVVPEDALELKCKLAAWRIAHYKKDLVDIKKPAIGRLGDIISPLYSILLTFFPEKENNFLRLLRKIELQKKEEATDTLEAKLVEIVAGMEMEVNSGFLATAVITSKFNEGKTERFALPEETIGRILKGLGFIKRRGTRGVRGIYYDLELIAKLKLQYGIDDLSDGSDRNVDIPNGDNNIQGNESIEVDPQSISYNESQLSQLSLNLKRPIDEFDPDEKLAIGKAIFGEGTKWAEEGA